MGNTLIQLLGLMLQIQGWHFPCQWNRAQGPNFWRSFIIKIWKPSPFLFKREIRTNIFWAFEADQLSSPSGNFDHSQRKGPGPLENPIYQESHNSQNVFSSFQFSLFLQFYIPRLVYSCSIFCVFPRLSSDGVLSGLFRPSMIKCILDIS